MDIVFVIFMGLIALTIFLWNRDRKQQLQKPADIDINALADPKIQAAVASGHKINAIKIYRELTGVGLKDAKDAIEFFEKHPEILSEKKKAPELRLSDSGIRDLIDEGRTEEAIEIYQKFAGVDEYTARDAVEQIKRESSK
jgi:tetratricopeptide (TPR) repeat protein